MKVVIWQAHHLESRAIVEGVISIIKQALTGHDVVVTENKEVVLKEIADADAMYCYRMTPGLLKAARHLKWIQFGSAGIDHTMFPELLESEIILTTMSGIHRVVVAEHAMALMLALVRRLDISAKLQANHSFDRSEMAATSEELFEKTVGIVGLGNIGIGIAGLAKAFGMRVIGTKRTPVESLPNVDEIFPSDKLDEILRVSDFLVLAVPLTSATRALIGKDELALMKPDSYIINIARGAMIDHDALSEALHGGVIRGAALDVFPVEPLPSVSPIYDMPNTIITPHTAGSNPQYVERASAIFKKNLEAFLSGSEMINVYRKDIGY